MPERITANMHPIMRQASSRIIGRQGAFIKQLQRESGCKINTLKDTELRSGLNARVMNVCGTNSAMSKGLYLIARKIASRWEYAPEWEGGDPTLPAGQGLPAAPPPAHSAPPQDPMDGDSSKDGAGRRQRGGQQRSGGRGGRDRGGGGDLDRYERDGGRSGRNGESDRRGGGGGGGADRSSEHHGAREGRFGRGGGSGRDDGGGGGRDGSKSSRGGGTAPLQTTSAPWITDQQPTALPSAVGGLSAPAPAPGSAAAAAASAEAWQRLLGQIPATARESLGFGAVPVPVPVPAPGTTDVFGQFSSRAAVAAPAAPQQLQQPPQVCRSWFCCCMFDFLCAVCWLCVVSDSARPREFFPSNKFRERVSIASQAVVVQATLCPRRAVPRGLARWPFFLSPNGVELRSCTRRKRKTHED